MALNSGKILMRRGQEVNFDPSKMIPGEWAVSLDSKYVRMCFQPGVCVRMATYDAFEADMVQIQRILTECQTVEEAVQRIYEEIKDVAVDVERIETAAANALKSEQNALNSANSASQSANTATQKASDAAGSANTASAKAEQATEGARIATEKASEAANSVENVRNMSDVSQSYAVGGTGTREGEDTDNSKYYNQQASDNADRAESAAERASAVADVGIATTEKAGLVRPDGETIRVDPDGTIHADRGTTSYTDLENKPKINDVVLEGEKTLEELGIASKEALEKTDNKVNIIIENAELKFKETASGENIHLDDSADAKLVEFALYGKSRQNGTPTPQNPVDIEVAGSGGSVEVKSIGKNLLHYPYYDSDKTSEEVTFKVLEDGSIVANGTSNGTSSSFFLARGLLLKEGDYVLSGCPGGGSTNTHRLRLGYGDENTFMAHDLGNGASFTLDEDTSITVLVQVFNGYKAENIVYKPMIRLVSDTDATYEPYKETVSIIQTENGLAGIPVDSGGSYTDQNGQQWICDEIVKYADGSGEYVKRISKKIIDGVNNKCSYVNPSLAGKTETLVQINFGASAEWKDSYLPQLKVLLNRGIFFIYSGASSCFRYGLRRDPSTGVCCYYIGTDEGVTDIATANTWLQNNPVTLYYAINPIRTPLTSEELAEIEKLKTFYPATNISNDSDCGMKVKYIVDSKNYIDNKLALQAKAREEEMMSMLLLLPEETQAKMIEKDTNNLLNESEA